MTNRMRAMLNIRHVVRILEKGHSIEPESRLEDKLRQTLRILENLNINMDDETIEKEVE